MTNNQSLPCLVCATTYEPDPAQLDALILQLASFGEAHVFDNSSAATAAWVSARCLASGVRHVTLGTNVGTAGALNWALAEADQRGLDWLLYFDQDSHCQNGYVDGVQEILGSAPPEVAMIGSQLIQDGRMHPIGDKPISVSAVISSGTLVRTAALLEIGGFDEDFFLDLVDHEACLGLRSAGWSLTLDPRIAIEHTIGQGSRRVPLIGIRVSRHPWWRRQLLWRNTVLMVRRYWKQDPYACARHLVGRVIETLCAAVFLRDLRFLKSAVGGARQGLRTSPTRHRYLP